MKRRQPGYSGRRIAEKVGRFIPGKECGRSILRGADNAQEADAYECL